LDPHEALLLKQVCRTADLVERLEGVVAAAEPSSSVAARHAVVELRQQRMTLARLIAALRLPSGLQQDEADAAARARDQRRSMRGFYGLRSVPGDA
jgi:hypothetical protein